MDTRQTPAAVRVLVVEDNPAHAELIRRAFDRYPAPFVPEVVETAAQARDAALREPPRALVADLVLPDGQGVDLLAGWPGERAFPLVVMTSHAGERAAVDAIKAGAADYLIKTETSIGDLPRATLQAIREWDLAREKRAAEEAFCQSEERYRELVESINEVVFSLDLQGRFLYLSPRAEAVCGYAPAEMTGKIFVDFVHPDDLPFLLGRFHEILAGKNLSSQYRIRTKDGSWRWVESSSRPAYTNGTLTGITGLFTDVTERRKAQEEQSDLLEKVQHSQKMEAIGTLAGGLAHDFNNILGAVLGYTEMALYDPACPSTVHGYLTEAMRSIERARDLVRQILLFARDKDIRKQPLRLDLLFPEILRFLRSSLPAAIGIQSEAEEEMAPVEADATQFRQVIKNLAANAADAMGPDGGTLTVRLMTETFGPGAPPPLPGMSDGAYARLDVQDTGHGMDEITMARVFEPYFSTKGKAKSSGLGLSVTHGIVKAHNGHIMVQSKPGEGACFSLYFPCLSRDAGAIGEELARGSFRMGRVLFVDDEAALMEIGVKMLGRMGFDVVGETSGQRALEMFQAAPGSFDAVVTDQTMPPPTGEALAAAVLTLRPDIPVILTTGYSEQITEAGVKAKGIRALLLKPVAMRTLADMLKEMLERKPPGAAA
jgi:PAS domain S-box-containing protein